jgi:hypothetical protein
MGGKLKAKTIETPSPRPKPVPVSPGMLVITATSTGARMNAQSQPPATWYGTVVRRYSPFPASHRFASSLIYG